jgi:hypothetical protein
MTIKIAKKIKGYAVVKPDDAKTSQAASPQKHEPPAPPRAEVIQMHESVERPDVLIGSTYKVKSPLFEHALYVTINDIVLNPGTEHESRRPFEIFINSKNMDHFQWIVALTRIMSAVFRKGGDVTFLVEEMKAVFDPRGGYFKAGGIYMPSIVAEIGAVVEDHLKMIGLIHDPELSDAQKVLIAEKRAQYEANVKKNAEVGRGTAETSTSPTASSRRKPGPSASDSDTAPAPTATGFPPGATMCAKCSTQAVILMDGCATCLSCGYSKCG